MKSETSEKRKSPYQLARMRAGLTQGEASAASGVGRPTICLIEAGKQAPKLSTLIRLAHAYRCSLDELTGRASAEE